MPAARLLSIFGTVLWLVLLAALAHGAESDIVVQVTSGREFRGRLDAASDDKQLVLRTVRDQVTLRRLIQWERVISAIVNGQPTDVAALRELAAHAQGTGEQRQKIRARRIILQAADTANGNATPVTGEVAAPRVAMVAFDASIENWDADVETDGVVIDVTPLEQDRQLVPAAGTLEVELFAPQRRTLELAPTSGGQTLELVERWTRAIQPSDFTASGVRVRLPFGAITPELQPRWMASPYGLVHIRLAVPGHGVFEDSRDLVRLRPYAPNRDRLEMKTGQRFLPTENLGRQE
jgi:hypothetical protein